MIVGRSAAGKEESGGLVMLTRDGLEEVHGAGMQCERGVGVVRVWWHGKINQVSDIIIYSVICHNADAWTDRLGAIERPSQSALLAIDVAQWCKIAADQVGEKGDD